MSDIPPLHGTASLPGDDGRRIERILHEAIRCAASEAGLTITINNYGTVVLNNQRECENETQIGEAVMNEHADIHAVNSVVNYKSVLDDVKIMLKTPSKGASPEDVRVQKLLTQFAEALQGIDTKHSAEVELLSSRLEELSKQVVKPAAERKPGLLKMSAQSLKEAATTLSDIAPGLSSAAEMVVKAISDWITQW